MKELATHNGTWTVMNPATGQHRTFCVNTVTNKEHGLYGKRIIGLLSGPDNTADYFGFGFVNPDGSIVVWKKHRGTLYEKYAKFLMNLDQHTSTVQVLFEGRCCVCNRKLTTPESILSGIGPVCAGRAA